METWRINSKTDIAAYVANSGYGADLAPHGLDGALADAIQSAEHPDYGTNWAEWLESHVPELHAAIVANL